MTTYPIYDFGGAGALMHFAPANGFPPQVYHPLCDTFTQTHHVISLLPRALWGTHQPPAAISDWKDMVMGDLLDGLRAINAHDVVLVGHSFGAIASMLAVIEEPERFKALVLLDPTFLSREIIEAMRMLRAEGRSDQIPLAARTFKRRRAFEDRAEARAYFKARPLFADWDDAALDRYVRDGLRDVNGQVELVWPPEWEAYYYMSGYLEALTDVHQLRGLVPTLMMRGAESDTFLPETAQEVHAALPDATYVEVTGHGHLFPMSAPQRAAETISAFLAGL